MKLYDIVLRIISGKVKPHSWTFVAFTYNSIENWGTFHVGNTFGYYEDDPGKEHPVSCQNFRQEGGRR